MGWMKSIEEKILRYSRNILVKEIGPKGQEKISSASVFVAGAGGLGSPVLLYLAAAGIGKIGIIDHDRVDVSNLQRQILYREDDVGRKKAEVAASRVTALSGDTAVVPYAKRLTAENIMELIEGYDIVVDGTDTFEMKFLINDACVLGKKPYVHGGVLRYEGQFFTYIPGVSGCLRCLLPEIPSKKDAPTCSESGIVGSVAGILGSAQATEVLKHVTGSGNTASGRVVYVNTLTWSVTKVEFEKNKECPACSGAPVISLPLNGGDYGDRCGREEALNG